MVAVNAKPFPERFDIDRELKAKSISVKTGDIFFRETDTRAVSGLIPFSALVSRITDSLYSHASLAETRSI